MTIVSTGLRGLVMIALALSIASTALAQTPSANISVSPPNMVTVVTDSTAGTVVAGIQRSATTSTAVPFATIVLASNQNQNVQVSGIPITLNLSAGATSTALSNCQLFNQSGAALSSGTTLLPGTNTVTLNSALVIPANTVQNLTLRCNVTGGALGDTFQIVVNSTALAVSATPTTPAPVLTVTATTIPAIQFNTIPVSGVTLGTLRLDASPGGDIRISSIPVSVTTTGGASAGNLSNCQLFNQNGAALNAPVNVLGSGTNVITLTTPLVVGAGTSATLTLRCTVSPGVTTGGILQVTPGGGTPVSGVVTSTGVTLSPAGTSLVGTAVSIVGAATIPVPGVPNTGVGTNTPMLALLSAVLFLTLAGGIYLQRSRTSA
ncbi:MAG: LPXTG cell wall anchor domain-containing protein [bacterium]|nr:LPXTG cell wall anchor domain-containing protein [bacterium]